MKTPKMYDKAPLTITHFDISKNEEIRYDTEDCLHDAHVFIWWENIPMGVVNTASLTNPGTPAKSLSFWSAILPTLRSYGLEQDDITNDNKRDFDFQRLKGILSDLFSKYLPTTYPDRLPMSLVICTHNRPNDIRTCLERIEKLKTKPSEIIIIDNASPNNLTEQVCKDFTEVRYFKEPKKGLSQARNLALEVCTQEIIAFTDDDVQVEPHWLFRVWESFQGDENITAMTGLVLPSEIESEAQAIFEQDWSFNKGYIDKTFDKKFFELHAHEGPPVWEIGAGANMAFRKSVFVKAGIFDLHLGAGASGCSEDSEMWFRIIQSGKKIVYNPRAIVFHKHRETMEGLASQIHQYMKGHAVAALIQHRINPHLGYKRRIFRILPSYYYSRLKKYHKLNPAQKTILNSEMKGLVDGIVYYWKHFKPMQRRP
jgi:GT2 family glycosyltransferase